VLISKFLFDLLDSFLNEVLNDGFISNLPLKFLINLSFGIGDNSLHHLVLLFHFSILEALDLPELLFLPTEAMFPLHPLFCDQLPYFLLLPE